MHPTPSAHLPNGNTPIAFEGPKESKNNKYRNDINNVARKVL
jgi:hypothetical protein